MRDQAIEPADVQTHMKEPGHFGRFGKDQLVGLGMAVVMLVAMAGWLYALGWTAWQAFLWLAH